MTATDPTIQLELLLREWSLEDHAPPEAAQAVELAHRVRVLHEPGACVPSWRLGRGASPVAQLVLALLLAGLVWSGLLAFLPPGGFAALQQILILAAALLAMAALLTVLLSKARRSRTHGKLEAETE